MGRDFRLQRGSLDSGKIGCLVFWLNFHNLLRCCFFIGSQTKERQLNTSRFTAHKRVPIALLGFLPCVAVASAQQALVQFNRDVRPILAEKCLLCHGADAAHRKADLRLDVESSAYDERDGVRAIVPGEPGQSELIRRISTSNRDEVMPPPGEGEPLSWEEKSTLAKWIMQGASYERHWAFQTPMKAALPVAEEWGHNEIDWFIFARLQQENLKPQHPATKEQLIRRVTFDLTGLPPTIAEVDSFLSDDSGSAFEKVVDRLLASPRYGERMAIWWLDGARYGDSHGYDNDFENSQWPWRNWVIAAFNDNKPFDEFTIEQLAGDLFVDATNDQIMATGFNRNHRIQTEGGAIDEEWRTEYVIDRVETMGAVWMGLTLTCARCHDHKYDPLAQEEFYQLFAMFNNLAEKGFINNLRGSAEPRIRYRASEYESALARISRITDKDAQDEEMAKLDVRFPTVMVMKEMGVPRKAFVLERGQYDAPGKEVMPGLPKFLPPLPEGAMMNRMGLAQWLVNGEHPLTARVLVNRLWEQIFGLGIVESSENMGVQSNLPTHPELLDWLAVDFAENGWDVKRLLKQMVSSATYRQSHITDTERLRLDPKNQLLSRGPRVRLSAEMMRDQALAISGLLVEQLGGPSVWTYQPAGLWTEVEKRGVFVQDHGESLYRRSLYSRIRRTVPPPSMVLFDLPSREFCTVKRARTNTPLQALALMNEVTYVEAAKKLAELMIENGTTVAGKIAWGFRRANLRQARPKELEILVAGYGRRLEHFQNNSSDAAALLQNGESKVALKHNAVKLAALTTVANVILNLDELINK